VNVEGTRALLEEALRARVDKVVHVSSAVVYGKPADFPFQEDSRPGERLASAYARSKAQGDDIAWRMFEQRGLPLVVVYPGAILGPGDPKPTGKVISDLLNGRMPAMLCPDSVLTFVDVRDVAQALVLAAEKPGNVGEKYLVGIHQVQLEKAYNQICELAGVAPPRLSMPNSAAQVLAGCLTALSSLTKRPPAWGLSKDMFLALREGLSFEGRKAERELGLEYTPLERTLTEVIEALRSQE
jgi:dihydroflavonol-4-reductase